MQEITATDLYRLAMSPLYVFHLVASAHVAPDRISQRQIVRSIECGLKWKLPLSERVFQWLRCNLHEFYADFSEEDTIHSPEHWHKELQLLKERLDTLAVSEDMVADFKEALTGLARFVAEGGAFRQKIQDEPMRRRVEWIRKILDGKHCA